ncbi:CocE/NonD family hydrolase [Halobellus sp. GM3]|uniref:CocE/NonD family hydrolase n=1 Tax=Halobellus sp. GM3 TaxID=3458410 RepID=UPI00403DBE96
MTFRSDGERCGGRLYRPDRPADPPLVVLSGGPLGADASVLDRYAERVAAAGYAAFRFDVRHTGDSDGEPRNLLSPSRQRADWEAAIGGLRSRGDVASDRIVLWGTDLAGGTVLDVAADDPRISAVVSQTPIRSGRAYLRSRGLGFLARGGLAGVRDRLQSRLFGPHTIPVVDDGLDDAPLALVETPGAGRRYRELLGDDWENRTPARSLLALVGHTGADAAPAAPTLFVGGTRDDVAPIESVEEAAEPVPNATLVRLPVGHFDPYDGADCEQVVGHGLAFFDAVLDG